jgi:hypothetical protein
VSVELHPGERLAARGLRPAQPLPGGCAERRPAFAGVVDQLLDQSPRLLDLGHEHLQACERVTAPADRDRRRDSVKRRPRVVKPAVDPDAAGTGDRADEREPAGVIERHDPARLKPIDKGVGRQQRVDHPSQLRTQRRQAGADRRVVGCTAHASERDVATVEEYDAVER